MFARKVAARLKPDALPQFTDLMERQIIPWLRTQEGFLDLIILSVPGSTEVATISFWDHQANAEAYQGSGFSGAVEILAKLLDSTPYVKTFEVVSSTLRFFPSAVTVSLHSGPAPRPQSSESRNARPDASGPVG